MAGERAYETIRYEDQDGVGWVTLDRPDRLNAFDDTMCAELQSLWRDLRDDDGVRCIVLTGSGDKAFCTGLDRSTMEDDGAADFDPLSWDDPGMQLGPKANGLWKPVIAAVNGMACGGAFYLLGEVEFIIAAKHATFFDPHVTYGMTAVFEPILMSHRMPFGELARLTLLGNHERMTADRACEVGLVSQVTSAGALEEEARWAATAIASQPPRAVQATVRALWAARELSRQQALGVGTALLNLGTDPDELDVGQALFASGTRTQYRKR